MEEALKRASDAGWKPEKLDSFDGFNFLNKEALLDPLFWKAIGMEEKWGESPFANPDWNIDGNNMGTWLYYQHRLIDRIAEGKSIDSFFDSILKGGISS